MVKDTVLNSGKLMEKKVVERSLVRMNTISDMLRSNLKLKNRNRFSRLNTLFINNNSNRNHAFQDSLLKSQNISGKRLSLEDSKNESAGRLIQIYSSDEEETVKRNVGVKKPVYLNDDYTNSIIQERLEEEYDSEEGQTEEKESNKEQKSPSEIKQDAESSNQKLTPNEEMRKRIEQKISRNNSQRFVLNNSGRYLQSQVNSKIKFEEPDLEQSYMPFNFSKTQKFLKTKGRYCVTLKLTLCVVNYQIFSSICCSFLSGFIFHNDLN